VAATWIVEAVDVSALKWSYCHIGRFTESQLPPESLDPNDHTATEKKGQLHMEIRPPMPPFTHDAALQKVRLAEDGWNTRDAAKVATAYRIELIAAAC